MELKLQKRDVNGLIIGQKYEYNEEGTIDYRKMIGKEHLYINPQNKEKIEKKYGKKYDELDIENDKIEDKDLVVLLSGLKWIARIRGYRAVRFMPIKAEETYAATACEIDWLPNFETENRELVFQSLSCAHMNNTNGFGRNYLIELAENRSFCRCIRNFLGISVVSKEELGGESYQNGSDNESNGNGIKPIELLTSLMKNKNKTFDDLKNRLIKEGDEEAQNYTKVSDFPLPKIFKLIEKLKKVKDKE